MLIQCDAEVMQCKVFDPFCGSGTVGIVCQRSGRQFIGLDLNYSYLHDIAHKRIKEWRTGKYTTMVECRWPRQLPHKRTPIRRLVKQK
jgi:DNA modification methylase